MRWRDHGVPQSSEHRYDLPDERSRALVWAGGFLVELARDKTLPLVVRQRAVTIARHFPTIEQVEQWASTVESSSTSFGLQLGNPRAHPEWVNSCPEGPLTFGTRLSWPD